MSEPQPFLSLANAFSLKGELALIAGGASGLGRDQLQTAAAELGPNAHYATHDVADTGKALVLAALVKERFGSTTILVNNAEDTDELEFRQLIDTHLLGAYAMTKAFIPSMSENGHGSVLFTASMASFFGLPKVFADSTAKSAYLGMVRSLAAELRRRSAAQSKGAEPDADEPFWRRGGCGLGRRLSGVAEARFVNGVVFSVDGGMLMGF